MRPRLALLPPLSIAALLAGCGAPPAPQALGGMVPPDMTTQDDAGSTTTDAARSADSALVDGSPESSPPATRDAGPPPTPICDPTETWSPVERIASIPATGFGRFAGISANELTIAWTSPAGLVSVADRPSRTDAFGQATVVDTGAARVAIDRAALDSAGTILYLVSADRTTFVGFERAAGATTWMASMPKIFANVAAMTADGGGTLSEPVLGADGVSLFYLLTRPAAAPAMFESTWDAPNHVWRTGTALAGADLASADATHVRRPTGASSDGLTLFFFDAVSGAERAAWRPWRTSDFEAFDDLPGLDEAAPNTRCGTLYFQGQDSVGEGAFVAQ